ncbi:MAG: transcriptional regulator [Bacillota bacterium]|nr:transcriptional regulator [Bacillota bacterium]
MRELSGYKKLYLESSFIVGTHPWSDMTDEQLLKSAGLYGVDRATGQTGYNLAAVMLLGKDDVIQDVAPTYVTDALVRKGNVDRYDDREVIRTNLIESFEQLMEFARKHLSDKFYLEGDQRKSLRNIIAREMLVNTLIHRELTSSFIAKFVIEKKKIYVENANRATKDGVITPENLEPNPKNPIIAAFFRNIGYADQLGSGVRNLYKYSRLYSGKDPEFKEGDVFRITVPLEEEYSFDYENRGQLVSEKKTLYSVEGIKNRSNADKTEKSAGKETENAGKMPEKIEQNNRSAGKELSAFLEKKGLLLTSQQKRLLAYVVLAEEGITSGQAGEILGVKQRRAREILKELTEKDILCKRGSYRDASYILNEKMVG